MLKPLTVPVTGWLLSGVVPVRVLPVCVNVKAFGPCSVELVGVLNTFQVPEMVIVAGAKDAFHEPVAPLVDVKLPDMDVTSAVTVPV